MRENLIVSTPSGVHVSPAHQATADQLAEPAWRAGDHLSRRHALQLASSASASAGWHQRSGSLGAQHGTTVAVMDWDSHRYLESYFAIPMMGATLFTVNVRLSPHQIVYALNHSEAEIVLVHAISCRCSRDQGRPHRRARDGGDRRRPDGTANHLPFAGEYETLVAQASSDFEFGDFDEQTKAATFYTTGTTGDPKGVNYSHRDIVLHTLVAATRWVRRGGAANPSRRRVHADHADVPRARVGHPVCRGHARPQDRAAGPIRA